MTEQKLNSLGFAKPPAETRVVVAMSGGVDSSVAAALLKEEGYEVIGITMQLYDHGQVVQKKGPCCAGLDIYDAQQVASKLSIPHYVLDYETRFKQAVIDDFVDSYVHGETPVPCIRCNQTVKFRDLYTMAKDLGAEALATGHYVQRHIKDGTPQLHAGLDPARDQSYFLFTTTKEQLDFLRFPLGGKQKQEMRDYARTLGLEVADKPDSQDICFVPDGKYASLVEKLKPGAADPGEIVHVDGTVLGEHKGIIHYTIGQRKGLGIGGGDPLYVVSLNPEKHQVIVGPKEALAKSEIWLKDLNWLDKDLEEGISTPCSAKYRSTQDPIQVTLTLQKDGLLQVVFKEPQYGVSPGQACVFYEGSRVLGGGWITR